MSPALLAALLLLAPPASDAPAGHAATPIEGHEETGPRLTDVAEPLAVDTMPKRPKPLVELGEPFLGTGTLDPGFTLPTGAVWQPSALVFGTLRTAFQSFEPDTAAGRVSEVAARLDLFLNLQLSGSERLVVGSRLLDGDGRFTSYYLEHPDPALDGRFDDQVDADLDVLFFEGDFGEIFPDLDRRDFGEKDVGFSLGRQPLLFQEGLLINDNVDGLGVTRNTLLPANASNFRVTLFYAWGNLDSSFGAERDARMLALLTSTDVSWSTIDADLAYLQADDTGGDLLAGGISFVQRLGKTSSSFRLLASHATEDETLLATDGVLLFGELGWTPPATEDHVYCNLFWAVDRYTPAARGSGGAGGGPLGRAGINFAAVDLGSFEAALSSQAWDVAGGAVGYQRFFAHGRRQLLAEVGFRFGTAAEIADAQALTVRYQAAVGRRLVVVVDGFAGRRESLHGESTRPYGGRLELVLKF